jgi:HSP20 family molecular chaperone IbpA
MAAPAKTQVPLPTSTAARDIKEVGLPAVKTSQLSTQPLAATAPIMPWVDPAAGMMAPFTNLLGGGFGLMDPLMSYTAPVLNIFNREMSHLNQLARRAASIQPPSLVVDVEEKAEEIVIDAHIGAPKECVTLEHDQNNIFITACRCDATETSDKFAYRRESWSGTSSRTIYVGPNFDIDNLTQSFTDGRLTVKVPRVGGSRRKQIVL